MRHKYKKYRKITIKINSENYDKLKKLNKEDIDYIINESLRLYFNKDFCARELERNAILGF